MHIANVIGSFGKKIKDNSGKVLVYVVISSFIFSLGVQFGRGEIGNISLKSQNGNLEQLDYSAVKEVYGELKQGFDGRLDKEKLEDGLKEGLVKAAGDPYTEYLNVEAAKDFNEDLSGSFTGIGAELSKDAATKTIIVVSPIAGFPADKAGIKPKDAIVEIDGKSAYDISVSEAVKRIRGPKDSVVKLKLLRGTSEAIDLSITRQEITIPSVETKMLDDNVGYIKVSRFGEDTASLAADAAKEFKEQNVAGIILDMRGNPGGLLDAAVDVSSLWVPKGQTILTERRDNQIISTKKSQGSSLLGGIPTAVLIDEGSASASEITAGALHDHKLAKLIGKKSFGKGSVQQVQDLRKGGILKVTVARWFTPNGKNIDKSGIEPDEKIERTDDDIKNNKDPQLDAAIAHLKK